MKPIDQIADELIRSVSGGDHTTDTKWEGLYIEALIPELRAEGIGLLYNGGILPFSRKTIKGNRRFHPLWVQKFNVNIVTADQDSTVDYLTFSVPAPAYVNDQRDGSIYLGQKRNSDNFHRAWSRSEISDLRKRGWIGQIMAWYQDGGNCEIYGNKSLNTLWVERILNDPTEHPDWTFQTNYPVDGVLLSVMEDLFKARMGIALKLPKDTVADAVPTNEKAQIKANL